MKKFSFALSALAVLFLIIVLSGCVQPMTCEQYADYVQQETGKLDKTCSTAPDCGMGLSYMCRPFCINKDVNMPEFHSNLAIKRPELCPLYKCRQPELECACQNKQCVLVPSLGKECETDANCAGLDCTIVNCPNAFPVCKEGKCGCACGECVTDKDCAEVDGLSQCMPYCKEGKCQPGGCDAIGRKCQADADCIGKHGECPKSDCTEPEIACENGVCSCTCPKPQIKTDKMEYTQGETVRAEVEASADGREYFYDSTIYPYSTDGNNPKIWVEMLENGRWAIVLKGCAMGCGDTDCNSGRAMPCIEIGPGECSKLRKYLWEWNMKTCEKASGTADGNSCQYIEEYDAKPGTYRLSLDVSPNSCNEGTAVHSNEFTIKQA
jgi:hypothetical protein